MTTSGAAAEFVVRRKSRLQCQYFLDVCSYLIACASIRAVEQPHDRTKPSLMSILVSAVDPAQKVTNVGNSEAVPLLYTIAISRRHRPGRTADSHQMFGKVRNRKRSCDSAPQLEVLGIRKPLV